MKVRPPVPAAVHDAPPYSLYRLYPFVPHSEEKS